jgi:excisionase family DNA binding protein
VSLKSLFRGAGTMLARCWHTTNRQHRKMPMLLHKPKGYAILLAMEANEDNKGTRMLTTGAVARRLGVTAWTVRQLIERGELPALRVTKHYRVRESDLEAFIQAHKTK